MSHRFVRWLTAMPVAAPVVAMVVTLVVTLVVALVVALVVSLMAALSFTARAATAEPVTLRDDRGVEHRFAQPPQRIVTLMPSLTETVWVLGGGAKLVGVDRYSNWPRELASLPRLGGLDDALIEAIVAAKPDVVLASTSARSLDRLDALGVRVLRVKSDSHADMHRSLELVARLLGTPGAGERLWSRLEVDLRAAAQRVPAALRGRSVYFEVGGGPYAAGTTSFIGETLTALGMGNIVPGELGPFPKLNPEFVVRARPDIVMIAAGESASLSGRPGWAATPALSSHRVCAFEPEPYDVLVRPGPRLGEAAALLADCLQRVETPR